MSVSAERVRQVVKRPPTRPDGGDHPAAAVAAVLLPGPDLLFIRRAERAGDPWSGHVSFPGGRMEPSDLDPLHAAMREAEEEVDLKLDKTLFLGELDGVAPVSGLLPLLIHPFVFSVAGNPPLRPNQEVASIHRLSLEHLLTDVGRGQMEIDWKGSHFVLPCVDFEGGRLWGLTLRIVDDLLDRLDGRGIGFDRLRAG